MERLKLSELELVKERNNITGNFTSVFGEYYIPQIKRTGFYKSNACMVMRDNPDLIELYSSKILGKIGIPHADILLATDDTNGKKQNGCLSINILNENEHFVELDYEKAYNALKKRKEKENPIEDLIDRDLTTISTIPGITSKDLRERKEYLVKHMFISALIQNTDINTDNMLMIRNEATGKLSNPAYYDMGLAFFENRERRFFGVFDDKYSDEIIKYLYQNYPSQVVPLGKQVQANLKKQDVNRFLQEEEFKEFSDETTQRIKGDLFHKIELIEYLNSKEQNKFKWGTDKLHEVSKSVKLPLRDRVTNFLSRLRTRDNTIGRNENE